MKAINLCKKIVLFPIKLIMIVSIWFYKIFISPFLVKTCCFQPTCSVYALNCLKEFGAIEGAWLTAKRLIRCNPKSSGGFDPVPINIKGENKWLL